VCAKETVGRPQSIKSQKEEEEKFSQRGGERRQKGVTKVGLIANIVPKIKRACKKALQRLMPANTRGEKGN